MAVARGQRERPAWIDPIAILLRERGLDHERRYVSALRATQRTIVDLTNYSGADAETRTRNALQTGADFIVQPALRSGQWAGRPDVLSRVDLGSALGPWSYEVVDTKLANETRGGTVLQLCLYSELLGVTQGLVPERFHVVTPDPMVPMQTFRVLDFSAYFRMVRDRLEDTAQRDHGTIYAATYPERVEHCEVCRWGSMCNQRRHTDDHLSLVAGISRLQCRELQALGVRTLAELGRLPLPLPFSPKRGAMATYVRAREQARVQLAGRCERTLVHELLPINADCGLVRLPAPSAGDIFLDLEGDPFARDGGREYLFGLTVAAQDAITSHAFWALSDAEERCAFESTVDAIFRIWAAHPDMHVYHYSHYEPAAFKRLMGRHATREAEVDRMLRAELFVDLHAVVKHSIRASVENYSIKSLEPFYGFTRTVALANAGINLRVVERALELGVLDAISVQVRAIVEGYNRDDCVSALRLREWLEQLRASLEAEGTSIPRPVLKPGDPTEKISDRARRVAPLMAALTAQVPKERHGRTVEQQARWLLAQLLEWHRREDKAPWWEFFRLRDLTDAELLDEKAAISGLSFLERVCGTGRSPIDRYVYPFQDTDVRDDDTLHLSDGSTVGEVVAIDRVRRTLDIRKRGTCADVHPTAVFAHAIVKTDVLADSLLRLAHDVIEHGIVGGTQYQAARELLLRRSPRLRAEEFAARPNETPVEFAIRIATELEQTTLAIQGPPGAGKTFTAARMICELVRRGARVGVTAVSHKVIRKLLEDIGKVEDHGQEVKCLHKVTARSDEPSSIQETTNNGDALEQLSTRRVQVVGGTQWLWARPEAFNSVDVLVIDEAGQMSLANVLAASQAGRSLVLLGDPQQLEQPEQGTHPEGADRSALEHILGDHKTIPVDRGIFLAETWRLAPNICAFTSEVFYEGRLRSHAGLENQILIGTARLDGAGLWVASVDHEGNQNSSPEEVTVVGRLIGELLSNDAAWMDCDGVARVITAEDILVVAPYNAQVSLLGEHLDSLGVRVGTVDKFQGQEAAVVIYSMATSSPEDAPRGMEFLYSPNRVNVATSRARCACILVASPRLFEPECKSPRQMQLANALCRYVELAKPIDLTR